ncbi:MAG TPA: SpoIIE family protein phosphatase [Bryobacteraceae bacterium]
MVEKQPLQQSILAVLLLWALAAQLTYSGLAVYFEANTKRFAEVPFARHAFSTVITSVPSSYRDSGLHAGDDVTEINGEPFEGEEQISRLRLDSRPGDVVTLTVARNGKPLAVAVKLQSPGTQWVETLGLVVLLPLSCLLIGFYIAFARPRDPLAWITMTMLASFGQLLSTDIPWLISSPWRDFVFVYHAVLASSWHLWLVLFALYFPVPFAWWKRHAWLNWVLALPSISLASMNIYAYLRAGTHLRGLRRLADFSQRIDTPVAILFTIYIAVFFALLGWKGGIAKTPDAKRRLRLMSAGCTLALAPLLPVVFLKVPMWLETICLLMVIFFPITMAYVIVVERAMDIKMVVRSGVRYALAANSIKILRVILITALVWVTIELAQQSTHRWEGVLIAVAGVALIVTVGRIARRVGLWMDRQFFREAYNAELILTDLGSSVASIRDTRVLLQTVARRISSSLHVERIIVLLERGALYEPAYALGFNGGSPQVALDSNTATIRYLKQARSPSKVYFDDPQSWIYGTPDSEQRILRMLEAQLLLPVEMNSRLLGLISLGAKKSEMPYSHGDLQLLSAVASQTGLALENAELSETIRKEIAQRERVNRELEIARDVQQHLFPQKLPRVEGLDFAGYCRPAEGVGGDYYDFVRLTNDCLGVAIGDVSGKGIAAALLMASLQASLRGQTIKPCETLAEMVGLINRLVYEASAENRYATFFYAQYDPHNRMLRYVNAGHNAPMVLRCGTGEIIRLSEGGMVIGLFPDCEFYEGRVALERGDVFLAFTDGISEAMNSADDEFGEERLMHALREHKARTAADLISELLDCVDRFTVGARQHDDMTLVAVRVQ